MADILEPCLSAQEVPENVPFRNEPAMERATAEKDLLPLDRELEERLHWLIRLRWFAGTALFIGTWIAPPLLSVRLPIGPLTAVAGAVLLCNLFLYLSLKSLDLTPRRLRGFFYLQISLDWVAVACTVYLTGGILSPLTLSLAFHLVIGAILLSRRACYLLSIAAGLLPGAMAMLTILQVVPGPVELPQDTGIAPLTAVWIWCGLTLFFLIITYLATSISGKLREKEAALLESEHAVDRAYQEMESLYQLGQVVNSTLDIDEVLRLIAEHATHLLGGKAAFLRLFDKSRKQLYVGGTYGLSRAYIDKGPVDVDKSLVDLEALRGGTIQVYEVGDDMRFQYREEARREGLRSMLSCPIRAKNRSLGVIRVYTAEPHVFTEPEQKLLLNIANLGAVAILNAKSYSELLSLDHERVWFARTTHHELRAPLAAIQSSLEALPYAGPLNDTQQDLMERMRRRVQDAFDTIRDLLDLAAAQRLDDQDTIEPIRFEETIRPLLEAAREQAKAKGLSLVEQLDTGDCLVQAEPEDLRRIFSNLLSNAVKYTPAGQVTIGARCTEGWLDAWVQDTGMGISAIDQIRVFRAFYRSAAAKASGVVGTGLGLSIVRQVCERLGGTITLTSQEGIGTRFDVRIPLARMETPESTVLTSQT